MTRTVADAALMLNVMAGQHRDDPASVPDELDLPLHPDRIKGWRSSGVPTGLQIVGAPYDEATVLQIAAALERVRPWFDVPERWPDIA